MTTAVEAIRLEFGQPVNRKRFPRAMEALAAVIGHGMAAVVIGAAGTIRCASASQRLQQFKGENMNAKKILLAAMLASPLLMALPLQSAQAQVFDLRIGTPPPPPRVVEVPPPRPGFVWAPG